MKLRNIIITGMMWLVMAGLAVGCDQDSDVGSSSPSSKPAVVSIGFNINVASLINYEDLGFIYSDVTADWLSDATLDVIDAVWVYYKDNTNDSDSLRKIADAQYEIKNSSDNTGDCTGTIYAGIVNAALASDNGLTMDVHLIKYKDGYDGQEPGKNTDKVYCLGTLEEVVVIDQNVALGYSSIFDVTVDGVTASAGIDMPNPAN